MNKPSLSNVYVAPKVLPVLPVLALEDLVKLQTSDALLEHMEDTFQEKGNIAGRFEVLVGYESVGNWGCDSSNWFLLRERTTGKLYEASGSHCSCYGFEGQFKPELTTVEYLKSDKFSFGLGGYDSTRNYDGNPDHNTTVREWIAKNL